MRHAIPTRSNAGAPSTIPRLLAGLLLCGALVLPAATPASACGLDWASVAPLVDWTAGAAGPFTFPMTTFGGAACPPGLMVTIAISQGATSGAFLTGTTSHREDCLGCTVNNFGASHDLGVVFDPTAGGTSPVTITATFSSPFPSLKFEISDIDFSVAGAGQDHRLDQVTITSNAGNPTLTFKTAAPRTFSIAGNTATANCTGAQPTCSASDTTAAVPAAGNNPNPDSGTVIADFTALPAVTTVTITYTEAGNGANPSGRGVGTLANLTPVELMTFSVD